jgi:hypothetical protein
MTRLLFSLLILGLLASPSWAASTAHNTTIKRSSISKPKVQAHYSLIDGKPIHGQITQQSALPSISSCAPEAEIKPAPTVTQAQTMPITTTVLSSNSKNQTNKTAKFFKTFFNRNKSGVKERSWVTGINDRQAQQLALEIAEFIATQSNPETTTIILAKPVKKQWSNPLTPRLENALRQRGFAITQSRLQSSDAKVLRYETGDVGDTGVLLRLSFDGKEATRLFFTTHTQNLVSSYPFSIRLQGAPE